MVKATPEQFDEISRQTKKVFGEEDPRTAIFAGESSATADLEALALAKAKTNEGTDPREIWRDTGWFKGKDNKWRFEVDDSKASIVDGQIVHAELEKAYPGVFDEINVSVEPLEKGLLGSFNALDKKLKISSELSLADQLDTAIHELQHVIQEKEGFSPGGNPTSMYVSKPFDLTAKARDTFVNAYLLKKNNLHQAPVEELINKIEKTGFFLSDWTKQNALKDQETDFIISSFFYNASPKQREALTGIKLSKDANKRLEKVESYKKPKEFFFEALKAEYPEDLGKFNSADEFLEYKPEDISYDEAFDKYKKTLGEAEARAATDRKDLQSDQRRSIYPEDTYLTPEVDVPYEDTWIEPAVEFPNLTNQSFAEGGSVEKQMNKLYQEGGLADDGTDIEPVTGNEVPTGSLDQEVRDNIPAQLSEGEYVVPADVVRYYGVKFFEDLRGQAKQDFARMESEGRVGGEPVDSTGMPMEEDEELSPEEMQMLQEALGGTATGMAMGGMVPQQQQMQYNPYEQQQMQYSQPARQPMFQTTRAVGMQEGGDVPSFNPSDYSYGGGFQSPFGGGTTTAGQGGMQLVEYINPTSGQTRMITVLNGEPIGMVPEGFIPSSPEARKQAQEQNQKVDIKTEGTRQGGERGPDDSDLGDTPEAKNPSEMSNAELSDAHGQLTGPGRTIGALVAGIPAIGPAFNITNNLRTRAVEKEMKAREMEVPDTQSLTDQVSDMFGFGDDDDVPSSQDDDSVGSQGSDPMGGVGRSSPSQTGGTGATASGRAGDGTRGGSSPSAGQTGGTGATAGGRAGDGSRGGGGSSSGGRGGQTGGTGATAGGAAGDGSRGGGSSSSGDTSGAASGPAGASGTAGAGGPSGDNDAGTPRAKGGLMGNPKGSQRKKPVKNKQKGLASK